MLQRSIATCAGCHGLRLSLAFAATCLGRAFSRPDYLVIAWRNWIVKKQPDFDAVVVGAGVTGMYQTYRLREAGFKVKGIDGSSGVGGSWHVNRYPGCRVDSESHTYSYFWNPELLKEFNWTELFASQPEVLRYLNRAADYMDIRKDYMFNTRIKKSVWDEENQFWVIHLEEGGSAPLTTRC